MRDGTHRLPGLVLTEHRFAVPVDHADPGGERLTVFAREAVAEQHERDRLPWLLFLQGGPGGESPRPDALSPLWLKRALGDYRVLLLDQRGTGLSTPVDGEALARFASPEAQFDYLKHFRADSIVRDAEWIRHELVGEEPWSILGQSFGGFCALTYLSFFPEALQGAVITGGLAPLDHGPDTVYRATYRRVLDRNRRYYERYPEDRERVRTIVEQLDSEDIRLPDGARLTSRRFRGQGIRLGMSDGAERLHYLVERGIGDRFLRDLVAAETFETGPLYAIVHEACYCQGEASRWSAERVQAEFSEFDDPTTFTGEMVYPWMFEDYAALRPFRAAAELLAGYDAWPPLYDVDRLRANEVPSAAAVYANDMYVEREFSEQTAATVKGLRMWLTDEYEHDALRKHGHALLDRLFSLMREPVAPTEA
jgi:pimeloyl-ACP methyl ester carboxylesterase